MYDAKKVGYLSAEDKRKILNVVQKARDQSNLRQAHRMKLPEGLLSPRRMLESTKLQNEIDSSDLEEDASLSLISDEERSERGRGDAVKRNKSQFPAGPMIYGSFNNWQPQPLLSVTQLARLLDEENHPDFLQ